VQKAPKVSLRKNCGYYQVIHHYVDSTYINYSLLIYEL